MQQFSIKSANADDRLPESQMAQESHALSQPSHLSASSVLSFSDEMKKLAPPSSTATNDVMSVAAVRADVGQKNRPIHAVVVSDLSPNYQSFATGVGLSGFPSSGVKEASPSLCGDSSSTNQSQGKSHVDGSPALYGLESANQTASEQTKLQYLAIPRVPIVAGSKSSHSEIHESSIGIESQRSDRKHIGSAVKSSKVEVSPQSRETASIISSQVMAPMENPHLVTTAIGGTPEGAELNKTSARYYSGSRLGVSAQNGDVQRVDEDPHFVPIGSRKSLVASPANGQSRVSASGDTGGAANLQPSEMGRSLSEPDTSFGPSVHPLAHSPSYSGNPPQSSVAPVRDSQTPLRSERNILKSAAGQDDDHFDSHKPNATAPLLSTNSGLLLQTKAPILVNSASSDAGGMATAAAATPDASAERGLISTVTSRQISPSPLLSAPEAVEQLGDPRNRDWASTFDAENTGEAMGGKVSSALFPRRAQTTGRGSDTSVKSPSQEMARSTLSSPADPRLAHSLGANVPISGTLQSLSLVTGGPAQASEPASFIGNLLADSNSTRNASLNNGLSVENVNHFHHLDDSGSSTLHQMTSPIRSLEAAIPQNEEGISTVSAKLVAGKVSASVTTSSSDSAFSLGAQLPSLHMYLADSGTPLKEVTIVLDNGERSGSSQQQPESQRQQSREPASLIQATQEALPDSRDFLPGRISIRV